MDVQVQTRTVTVTPTIDTNAYSANDQVGGLQTLTAAAGRKDRGVTLQNVIILDKAAQSAEITIFFFDTEPTIASSNNATLNISDAEMLKCIGHVTVTADDYATTSANAIACAKPVSVCVGLRSSNSEGTLYAVAKTSGTPTYGSASDLVFTYVFEQDY